jgi:glycosyltransferase involved in cell wall biosynthesis
VPSVAERRLRLRLEHTRYAHWGSRSGYPSYASHLDPAAFAVTRHAAPDSHEDFPRWLAPLRPALLCWIRQQRMPWYKVSDLSAELRLLPPCTAGLVDVVHFLDGEHAPLLLPRLLRRGRRRRPALVASYHQPPGLLGDLVDPRVLRALDAIILMAPTQLSFFDRHVPPERLHVILHGIDVDFFRSRQGPRRPGPMRCLTVGHWLRDWRVFSNVATLLPDIVFDVVTGRAPNLGDAPNVRVLSGLDDEALAALYRDADVLFMPLLESTANNGLLEGMASGLAPAVTDLAAVRAYVPREAALMFPPGDPVAAADTLTRLRDRPELRAALGVAARRRAEALAVQTAAARHAELYRALAAGTMIDPAPLAPSGS